jgi:hypothetical protein
MEILLRDLERNMLEVFHKFNQLVSKDPIFWFCALVGSGLFVFQFTLNLIVTDSHDNIDNASSEMETGKFKWLSKQAVTGFLMMFGWVGLTCKKEFALSEFASVLFACVGGGIAIFVSAFIFKIARKLRSPGTIFRIEDAIGKEAIIYQRIPCGGIGKITVSLHHFTHEIEAISTIQEDLPSFTSVQIIKKADEKTVIVIPIK